MTMAYPISKQTQKIIEELMLEKDVVKFMDRLGTLTAELIRTNKPWLADIEGHISKLSDGAIVFTVKKFEDRVTEVQLTQMTRHRYK